MKYPCNVCGELVELPKLTKRDKIGLYVLCKKCNPGYLLKKVNFK